MRLEVSGIDHDRVRLPGLARQFGEDPIEQAEAAPEDEPVVDGLVRPIALGRIAPHQLVLDDIDDPRHNPPVVNSRNTPRKRETARSGASAHGSKETGHPSAAPPQRRY